MAAYSAADSLVAGGSDAQVLVLEKMPRPARKIMISGKGRCNFTNVKEWNAFSSHVRANSGMLRPAYYNLTPDALIALFSSYGMKSVVERGDRAFPESHRASDVVDVLVRACTSKGVKIMCDSEVTAMDRKGEKFVLELASGEKCECRRLILATGGLSYPGTGSTGDGYGWASGFGHRITRTFPSLTALVPAGYKMIDSEQSDSAQPHHIDRGAPLTELGQKLCGVHLKNIGMTLEIDGCIADEEFGDVDFTDGGLEGPLGFRFSRQAVKAMLNGGHVSLVLDLKAAVDAAELLERVRDIYSEIDADQGYIFRNRCGPPLPPPEGKGEMQDSSRQADALGTDSGLPGDEFGDILDEEDKEPQDSGQGEPRCAVRRPEELASAGRGLRWLRTRRGHRRRGFGRRYRAQEPGVQTGARAPYLRRTA